MKNNVKILSTAFLYALICSSLIFPTIANAASERTVSSENTGLHLINEGDHNKKKKGKKKKSRRKCIYCVPMRTFEAGEMETVFKAGLVSTYAMDHAVVKVPPLAIGLDYRISNKFSLGINMGHSVSESRQEIVDDGIAASWTNRHYFVGIRPGIHITSIENWDFYGGMSVGLHVSNIKGSTNEPNYDLSAMESHMGIKPTNIAPSFFGFVGVRYVISPKWILFCEAGYDISIFSIGGSYLLFK